MCISSLSSFEANHFFVLLFQSKADPVITIAPRAFVVSENLIASCLPDPDMLAGRREKGENDRPYTLQ